MSEIKEVKITTGKHIPQPPSGESWVDKNKDHGSFQLKVSNSAIQGGVSPTTGCMTPSAEQARREAESRYFTSQTEHFKKNLQKK